MAIAYGIILAVAIVLFVLYCTLIRKKEKWLLVLYACVCVVDLGYLLLSLSKTVEFALFANKVAYLGQIFLLISMYLTIAKLCGFKYTNKLPIALFSIGAIVFATVCTTGYLPWYYKEVTLEYADGAAKLVKKYGPLHIVYLIYVLAYVVLMIATIIWSMYTKKVSSRKHAGLLTAAVLCNIAMWIIEKFVTWNFEFLSVSYILSLGMLFFLYWMMQDYVHVQDVPAPIVEEKSTVVIVNSIPTAEKIKILLSRLSDDMTLTVKELEVTEKLLEGKTRKEIADELNISENTVKTHLKHIYEKLNISNKQELLLLLHTES
ncbi:MAG: hypothetical protein J6K86_02970 [Clostridia bacterium]|nr:hypothetical protein [Clostridia bacterium]